MATYRYVGDDVRVIPDLSREVKPGDEVDLDTDTPGPMFEPVTEPEAPPAIEPPPQPAPAPTPEG